MHGLLGLSALHLSLTRPQRVDYYRNMATALQSKALIGFNEILPRMDEQNCLSVLLFSHATALHVFCDIFNPVKDHFNVFLDRLVGCINLLRGLSVVRQTWWDSIREQGLEIILSEPPEPKLTLQQFDAEFDSLQILISSADMSQSSIEVCKVALRELQKFFHWEDTTEEASGSTNKLFAWLVIASNEYTELLSQRRAEALIVLAYYSVLLHRRQKSWVVGDAGSYLFNSINEHLGKHWEKWLEWPKTIINGDRLSKIT